MLLLAIDQLETSIAGIGASNYRISHDGRALISDLLAVLEGLRSFIVQKNQAEVLQKLFFHTSLAAKGTTVTPAGVEPTLLKEASSQVTNLIKLLLTSTHFRGILAEGIDILQSIFGTTAQAKLKERIIGETTDAPASVASEAGPDRDRETDRYGAAVDDSGIVGGDETLLADTATIRTTTRDDWRYGEPIVTRTLPTRSKVYLDEDGTERILNAPGTASRRSVVDPDIGGTETRQRYSYSSTQQQAGRSRQTTGQTSVHTAQTARASFIMTKLQTAVPEESRARIARRMRALLRQLNDDEEYQSAIEYLLSVAEVLANAPGTSGISNRNVDANVYASAVELKRLLEAMAGESLNPFLQSLYLLTARMRNDAHFREFARDARQFFVRAMREPAWIDTAEYGRRAEVLMDRARAWSVLPEAQDAITSGLGFLDALRADPVTMSLADSMTQLWKTAFYDDAAGQLMFKGDLVNDLRVAFIPALLSQMKFVALPRIEHRDADMDLILDNVILTSSNFLPNLFELEMMNRATVSPRLEIEDRFMHVFSLNAYQIQADIHDVSFYYKRKSGFPRLKDWGVADLAITGEGIHVHLAFELDRIATTQTLIPLRVQANVDDIRVQLHHTKHDTLYKLVAPAIKSAIRRSLVANIEQTLLGYLMWFDTQVTMLKNARLSARTRRLGVPGSQAPSFLRSMVPGFMRTGSSARGPPRRHSRPPLSERYRQRQSLGREATVPAATTVEERDREEAYMYSGERDLEESEYDGYYY
ncbi:hypothetical protein BC828DRAFT_397139 [Blastocladiella britannica]|nr:hypothetical protein BC828DRAFT_397139 [Blastocladiella britannica]